MRDVETLTDMYHRELLRTPTGKDPYIARFMERWGIEEITHGEVLNRFLNEAGVETDDKWQGQVRTNVSQIYNANTYLLTSLTNLLGRKFTATHMTFGAIHEMSTAAGYRRMDELADHPVLSEILNGIIREESVHTHFYWSVAKLELRKSDLAAAYCPVRHQDVLSPGRAGFASQEPNRVRDPDAVRRRRWARSVAQDRHAAGSDLARSRVAEQGDSNTRPHHTPGCS